MKEKLRIGVLLNDHHIPSWEYQMLSRLINSEYAGIVLVIKDNTKSLNKISAINTPAYYLIRLIEKTDRFIFKTAADHLHMSDTTSLLSGIPETEAGDGLDSEIRNYQLDIILSLGCHDLKGKINNIPGYGVWTYSADTCHEADQPGPGFWEVIRKIPVTHSTLDILSPADGTKNVIFSSSESTCRYSININRDGLAWRSALFAPRIINGIFENGNEYLNALKQRASESGNLSSEPAPEVSFPLAVSSSLRYLGGVIKSIIRKLLYTDSFRWYLQFKIGNADPLNPADYYSFRKLVPPRGLFWADPFVVAGHNCYWIFVEEFVYRKNKAHISVLRLDSKANFIDSVKIIEKPYHMSYPFIFKVGETCYMIPETSKNRTIELYRCTDFPYKWEFERNIMENISAVDTTLFRYNNKWWLFTGIDQTPNISGCSTELFLFFTDDIFTGKWTSHPLNPVVSDIRRARPAGKIFIDNGQIYRPSQNCAGRYGVAFNLNLITRLSESGYEEKLITEIKPVWDKKLRGTHTLNSDKDFTVIDTYSYRSRWSI